QYRSHLPLSHSSAPSKLRFSLSWPPPITTTPQPQNAPKNDHTTLHPHPPPHSPPPLHHLIKHPQHLNHSHHNHNHNPHLTLPLPTGFHPNQPKTPILHLNLLQQPPIQNPRLRFRDPKGKGRGQNGNNRKGEKDVWWVSWNWTGDGVVVVELLDIWNLVVARNVFDEMPESERVVLWQSFDHPGDTLFPGQKLGWDMKSGLDRLLSSWRGGDDPGTGILCLGLSLWVIRRSLCGVKGRRVVYRSGPWVGTRWSGVPEMNSSSSAYAPDDQCDDYNVCGPLGVCNASSLALCQCVQGFAPEQAWVLRDGSAGCVRKTRWDCQGDGFLLMMSMKLSLSSGAFVKRSMRIEECEGLCRMNCSCTAYADAEFVAGVGSGCVMWFGDLIDLRDFARVVRIYMLDLQLLIWKCRVSFGEACQCVMLFTLFGFILIICNRLMHDFFISQLKLYFYNWWECGYQHSVKLQQREEHHIGCEQYPWILFSSMICCLLSMEEEAANKCEKGMFGTTTNRGEITQVKDRRMTWSYHCLILKQLSWPPTISHDEKKLGAGGFGCVNKGVLADGQEVAVKRLSKDFGQGSEQFRNEVQLIAKLQHRNLVRLLGCWFDMEEKMLLYEYLPNRSLDSIIFSEYFLLQNNNRRHTKLMLLFSSIKFTCYRHSLLMSCLLMPCRDSLFRIIHRDLKASNILLDTEWNPKISDFGMERLFGGEERESSNTRRVVGTYDAFVPLQWIYMSPEYAMHGIFSVKSDVFSFGVLVLEIVTGRENRGFHNEDNEANLLGHAWKLWREGRGSELLDPTVRSSSSDEEVIRCIQVALLCVQERADDRPTMATVQLMLNSDSILLPRPKLPGFCFGWKTLESDSSSSKQDESLR
ncbi:Receptor-like serine/threonine-protein kinase SD1-7-like protein, partial [Drosera capensis]